MEITPDRLRIGVDVGSTTLKIIVLNSFSEIVYKTYRRHKAAISRIFNEELVLLRKKFPANEFSLTITGSAGMGIAERYNIPFVQEVVASIEVVRQKYPDARVMIDLGGEDAKMVYFEKGKQPDIRMNGSCAGGTGAFIDQMADLLNIPIEEIGRYAANYKKIYPVASRCGVFAKTDIQNLISRNVPVEDISMSILHTVALQTVTTLARGQEVCPQVICTGGPLSFIAPLKDCFQEILGLQPGELLLAENGEFFPAWGCALSMDVDSPLCELESLLTEPVNSREVARKDILPALFSGREEYESWLETRMVKKLSIRDLEENESLTGFLGIDSGSTTTKIVITDDENRIVYRFYAPNQGNPLKKTIEGLSCFFEELETKKVNFRFAASAATGYGEELIKSALGLDFGIVETMAHLSGAQYVNPDVSFILDIGGQDMKSMFIHKGVISNIELNEACSSGCGSFLQNFSSTMNMTLDEFSGSACLAPAPADLGTRCTVFMNSKVKQSLRENASLGDIAAGLAYSVVKNCLFKVLKLSGLNELGDHIVVQGGTFKNNAVYRALELLSGKTVHTTDCPELMGAFGAALYAKKRFGKSSFQTAFEGEESLPHLNDIETKEIHCKGCTNQCNIIRFKFANGNLCYAGNKCEKVFYNKNTAPVKGYNAFEMKTELLFNRPACKDVVPKRNIRIGIPRVLNMYENYPFWQTLFSGCGFEVVLSAESTFSLYQKGVGSAMSDNICFPAKLVHGHILDLVEKKVNRIFYPIVPKDEKEFNCSSNSYNCPVVSGYPDVVRSSMDPEENYGIPFDKPVISFNKYKVLEKACFTYFKQLGVDAELFKKAFRRAIIERYNVKKELKEKQQFLLENAIKNNEAVFVLSGRPYHADPLIHQKTGQILADLGVHVLTDDVFRKGDSLGFRYLNIVSQWCYPNRVVQSAMEIAKLPGNVQLIQMNSFGCGPDSFFMDEIRDILKVSGKNLTVLRIDEIASPGSVRLRLRSLIESLKVAGNSGRKNVRKYEGYNTYYTKKDRRKTILAPWFADFISPFFPALGALAGYKIVNLPRSSRESAEIGLMYGHNEVCYPSTLVLGDIIYALQSGKYDPDEVVVAITQTGGQCRATNYVAQLKSGLANAGFSTVPVLVFSTGSVYQNKQSAFKIPVFKLISITLYSVLYGDALQQMYSSVVSREKKKGESRQLFDFYIERGVEAVYKNKEMDLLKLLDQAVQDFNHIPVREKEFIKIGLIGEIYVKYNNYGQAYITDWLRERGMEVATPPVIDFLMQYFVNSDVNRKNGLTSSDLLKKFLTPYMWQYMNKRMSRVEKIMKNFRFHHPSESIYLKARYASEIIDLSNQFGEGWTIAGEVASYARQGVNRIVCIQPFGCIANHIVAKGIEKRIKKLYPQTQVLYLDVDGGMASVNLQNRLHFMIT